jgi:hypothetical protein
MLAVKTEEMNKENQIRRKQLTECKISSNNKGNGMNRFKSEP